MKKMLVGVGLLAVAILILLAGSVQPSRAEPMAVNTPTPVPIYQIDYDNRRECSVTVTGNNVKNYCNVEWLLPAHNYTTEKRLLGFWAIVDASNYIENFDAGIGAPSLSAPPYWDAGTGRGYILRNQDTGQLKTHSDVWTWWVGNYANYPTSGSCAGFQAYFPSAPCDTIHTVNKPYTDNNIWYPLDLRFYAKSYESNVLPDEGTPAVTVQFVVYPVWVIWNGPGGMLTTRTPTPTGTTTQAVTPYATNFPAPTGVCLTPTATYAGPATSTPVVAITQTPYPSPTCDHLPCAEAPNVVTPTATITATTSAIFVSDLYTFPAQLSPWSAVTGFFFPPVQSASWTSQAGADGQAGAVRFTYGTFSNTITRTNAPPGAIVFARPGGGTMPAAMKVQFSAKTDQVLTGRHNYLVVWQAAGGVWRRAHAEEIMGLWSQYVAVADSGGAPTTGIALQAVSCASTIDTCTSSQAYTYTVGTEAGALVDNVRLWGGSNADNQVLPVCTTGTDSNGRQYRICIVPVNQVDAYDDCVAPANMFDLAGWIPWLGCRIEKYFAWNKTNDGQISDLRDFGNTQEPIGTMNDIGNLAYETKQIIDQLKAEQPTTFASPDFSQLFSTSGLGPIDLYVPGGGDSDTVLVNCPVPQGNVNQGFRKGACWAIWMLKSMPATVLFLNMVQFLIDLGFFYWMCRCEFSMYRSLSL